MLYLPLTTLIHKNRLCTSVGIGAVPLAISMYQTAVGL